MGVEGQRGSLGAGPAPRPHQNRRWKRRRPGPPKRAGPSLEPDGKG